MLDNVPVESFFLRFLKPGEQVRFIQHRNRTILDKTVDPVLIRVLRRLVTGNGVNLLPELEHALPAFAGHHRLLRFAVDILQTERLCHSDDAA
ncbi:hypothetical protein D3C73_1282250 [compost metagenome]